LKIEKVNENKIKITLSVEDLNERDIDLYSFMYNSPESQDLFWDMIHQAEVEYGFNVDESLIYVEASTSGSGIFTLIVTKSNENHTGSPVLKGKIKKNSFKLKKKILPVKLVSTIFLFDNFDDICNFCKIINVKKLGDNSLYKLDDKYYLKVGLMPYPSILEYANIVKSPEVVESKFSEYGQTIIAEKALQTIAKHFVKKKRKV
jgi:adapter protein MecA 1/2